MMPALRRVAPISSADLPDSFFVRSAPEVAPSLIGTTLLVDGVGGLIVETEAYDQADPASHSFAGQTPRNGAMFGPPGFVYVYRSYGLHWCLNLVCGMPGHYGSAVLIRALEPTHRLDVMVARRGMAAARLLCAGPGRLCQALAVDGRLDKASLAATPFRLLAGPQNCDVVAGPRIGLSSAIETPWRFGLRGSRFLSRPFRPST